MKLSIKKLLKFKTKKPIQVISHELVFLFCYDNFPVGLHVSVTVLVTDVPAEIFLPVTLAIALFPLFEAFLLLNDQLEDGFVVLTVAFVHVHEEPL